MRSNQKVNKENKVRTDSITPKMQRRCNSINQKQRTKTSQMLVKKVLLQTPFLVKQLSPRIETAMSHLIQKTPQKPSWMKRNDQMIIIIKTF